MSAHVPSHVLFLAVGETDDGEDTDGYVSPGAGDDEDNDSDYEDMDYGESDGYESINDGIEVKTTTLAVSGGFSDVTNVESADVQRHYRNIDPSGTTNRTEVRYFNLSHACNWLYSVLFPYKFSNSIAYIDKLLNQYPWIILGMFVLFVYSSYDDY